MSRFNEDKLGQPKRSAARALDVMLPPPIQNTSVNDSNKDNKNNIDSDNKNDSNAENDSNIKNNIAIDNENNKENDSDSDSDSDKKNKVVVEEPDHDNGGIEDNNIKNRQSNNNSRNNTTKNIKNNIKNKIGNTSVSDNDSDNDFDGNTAIDVFLSEMVPPRVEKEYTGFYLDPDITGVFKKLNTQKGGPGGIKSKIANEALRTFFRDKGLL
jgi:hypothetical protein